MNSKKFFTYPVLLSVASGYNEQCKFILECDNPKFEDNKMKITFKYKMDCNTLKRYISNSNAKIWMNVSSKYYSKMMEINNIDEIIIDTENLVDEDSVKLHLEVIAEDNIVLCNDGSFNDRYPLDYEVDINKRDIMAESNECEIIYRRGSSSLFTFMPDNMVKDNLIEFHFDESVIRIHARTELLNSLETMKGNSEKNKTYNLFVRMIVLQAISSSLLLLCKNYEDYSEARWKEEYDVICKSLYEKNIKEKLDEIKDEPYHIHETAQEIFGELIVDKKSIVETIIEYAKEN